MGLEYLKKEFGFVKLAEIRPREKLSFHCDH